MVLLYLFWQYRAYFSVRYCPRWETGKWSPSTANSVRLAKALKVSVEDLYDDGEASIEDVATKQAVAEFQELKPQERGLVLTLIRELKKLREKD